jgi:hypothetical protein
MSRLDIGRNESGEFRARILRDGADPDAPSWDDILFDSDMPTMRVFESGSATLAWATGQQFGTNAGLTTINTVERPFIPFALTMIWRPYDTDEFGTNTNKGMWGVGPYNNFGGGTLGSHSRTYEMRPLGWSARGVCPTLYDDGVMQQIRGYRVRVYSNKIEVNNYFRSGSIYPVDSVTTCEDIGGGQILCTTRQFYYYGSNPYSPYASPQLKLKYHLMEMV